MPLIERAGACVGGMIFKDCEFRSLLAAPIFSRVQQFSADALILMPSAHRNL